MSKRWDDNDEFEFAGGNPEDDFWAEAGDQDDSDEVVPDMDDYAVQFREQELEIADKHLNTELLDRAIAIAGSSFFWYFMSTKGKLQSIRDAYRTLLRLVTKTD